MWSEKRAGVNECADNHARSSVIERLEHKRGHGLVVGKEVEARESNEERPGQILRCGCCYMADGLIIQLSMKGIR